MSTLEETIDIYCVDDFLPHMPTISGALAVGHRLARRLSTKRGHFPFWEDFGFDVRGALLSKMKPGFIESQAEMECLKDEQVETVKTTLTQLSSSSWDLLIQFTTADGPFEFTLSISEAKEQLTMKIQEAA